MSVGNFSRTIDHKCPGHRECPSSTGISFFEIETYAPQRLLGAIVHLECKTELVGNLVILINQDHKTRGFSTRSLSGKYVAHVHVYGVISGNWLGLPGYTKQKKPR